MKAAIKQAFRWLALNPSAWQRIGRRLVHIAKFLEQTRLIHALQNSYHARTGFKPAAGQLVVTGGPFSGMVLANDAAFGSAILPYLTGSYELELLPVWTEVERGRYPLLADIGCAQGYYAVGLARLCPTLEVRAYDIDAQARSMCNENARVNGVEARVKVMAAFETSMFQAIPEGALLLSDCEGFESEIFTQETAQYLSGFDLLIEMHDFIVAGTSRKIKQALAASHACVDIVSLSNKERLDRYQFPVVEALSLQPEEKYECFADRRWPEQTLWCWFKSHKLWKPDAVSSVEAFAEYS